MGGLETTPLVFKKKRVGSQKNPLVITIPKAVIKKAVTRNLIRRRIKSLIEPFLETADYTVIVKKDVSMLPFKALKTLVENLLK